VAAGRTITIGGPGFTSTFLSKVNTAGNVAYGFIGNIGNTNLDFFSVHHYGTCSTATLSAAATYFRAVRSYVDAQGFSGKPLHLTEWNTGLGQACGEAVYAEQRMQSWASGVFSLLQDPSVNFTAAHFYSGVTVMSLFDFSSLAGSVRVNPGAWAFWAHRRLRGATSISAQVCPNGTGCVNGYAAETLSLMATAATAGGIR